MQEAFWDNHGLQCRFCTSGILITAQEFLVLPVVLDRCTGLSIVDSVLAAADPMK